MACVLITGGSGSIGTAVAKELIAKGHEVKCLDLTLNDKEAASYFYAGSILDPFSISTIIRGCDYVIHLAAALGVERTEARRLECLYINIQGTINILEECVKENVKKILFTSSSEVYGNQNITPIKENSPVNPISNYAITKLVGEEYLRAYSARYPIEYTVTRLFNVYGEQQRDDFVVRKFVKALMENKKPVLYGDGEQVRSFCYVSDAAKGIVAALFNEKSNQEVFNVGNDQEPISMKDLAGKVINLYGANDVAPEFIPMADSDRTEEREVYTRIPCIEKAKRLLNYSPEVNLDEGIKRVIETVKRSRDED